MDLDRLIILNIRTWRRWSKLDTHWRGADWLTMEYIRSILYASGHQYVSKYPIILALTDIKLLNKGINKCKYGNTWVKYILQFFRIFMEYIWTQIEWRCTTYTLENQDKLKLKTLSTESQLHDISRRRLTNKMCTLILHQVVCVCVWGEGT